MVLFEEGVRIVSEDRWNETTVVMNGYGYHRCPKETLLSSSIYQYR